MMSVSTQGFVCYVLSSLNGDTHMKTLEEKRAYSRAYYAKNRDKIRQQQARLELTEARKAYHREYALKNKDRQRANSRAYEHRNPELVAGRKKEWRKNNPDYMRSYYLSVAHKAMLSQCRVRAKRKGIVCTITLEDIPIPEFCPVLGIPLFHQVGRGMMHNSPSVDRILPEFGYVRGNVVVISMRANMLKRDATADELDRVSQWTRFATERVRRELGQP